MSKAIHSNAKQQNKTLLSNTKQQNKTDDSESKQQHTASESNKTDDSESKQQHTASESKQPSACALELPDRTSTFAMTDQPHENRAYVWLLMKGDAYLPGVFVSVYSVKRTKPTADLVVMVTPDVSDAARSTLLKVATHICCVPYISVKSLPLKTQRQREMYGHWIESAYTKLNCLALPYKKIIFMDADTVHLSSTEDLFELRAPAAPYANPFVKPLGKLPDHYKGPRGKDGYPLHKAFISSVLVTNIIDKGGVLPISSSMVLTPSIEDYNSYINLLKTFSVFGFTKCMNGYDEQSICYYYSKLKKKGWYAIHQRYNYIAWKDGFLCKGDAPKVIHYMSETKPWMIAYNAYDDVITWYKMAADALEQTGIHPTTILITEENINAAVASDDIFLNKFGVSM